MLLNSSSGYGGLDASPLARIGYHNTIINKIYEKDFLFRITNSLIDERIVRCHQRVQLLKAPEVGPWRSYQANQEMVPNQVTAEGICLDICNAAYNAIKIDELTIHFACERWEPWEASFLEAVYERYVEMQRKWVLTAMILEASPKNKGSRAGRFGNIDLGSLGNPAVVTKDNIPFRFSQLQQVLGESLYGRKDNLWAVVPLELRSLMSMSNYANASWTGTCKPCSMGIDGMWEGDIFGFEIIETIHAPYVIEEDGRLAYYILAGTSSAFAYVSDIIKGRLVNGIKTFGIEYQMLAVWGGKMLYPDGVAVAYWTFQSPI